VSIIEFAQAEDVILAWTKTLNLTPKSFLDVEEIKPPVILLKRIGGGPISGGLPIETVRVIYDVWSTNRPHAQSLSTGLQSAIESLAWSGDVKLDAGIIKAGEVISVVWLPDAVKKVPRYQIGARFTVTKG
jgi:hypothetical protein